MNLQELVAKVSAAHPAAPQPLVTQVLRTALKTLRAEVEAVPEGTFAVAGFGTFRVRQVETDKDGRKETVRRTLFSAAKLRAVAPDAEGAAKPVRAAAAKKA